MIRLKRIRLFSLLGIVTLFAFLFFSNINSRLVDMQEKEKPKKTFQFNDSLSQTKIVRNLKVDLSKYDKANSEYIFPIRADRINRLFRKLHDKEKDYKTVLELLQVPLFDKIIRSEKIANFDYESYLEVKENQVVVTDSFIDYLNDLSAKHSFRPRNNVSRSKIVNDADKPVIVTAANEHYYDPLQATVFHVHTYFPDYRLIVYDLGLSERQLKLTKEKCKCEVIKYNIDNFYSKVSPHVSDLKKFSWKPLIIQESLLKYETVLYIDSSIRFLNNEIAPIVNSCTDVGMLTQYIGLKLVCYTNPKMFEWFEEESKSYEDFFTIEANILMFHRSFLTSILMKAWITCALDENCIAPEGSSTGGCCGCHRYDQDGLTIVNSFFYGHPKNSNYLPAYSFTTQESYFFEIRRYQGKRYFE